MVPAVTYAASVTYTFFISKWSYFAVSAFTLAAKKVFDSYSSGTLTKSNIIKGVVGVALKLPGGDTIAKSEMTKTVAKLETSVFSKRTCLFRELPVNPVPWDKIHMMLETAREKTNDAVDKNKCSGNLYHCGEELTQNIAKAEALATWTNTLHPETAAWVQQREAEIIQFTRELLGGNAPDSDVCGTMTSGGTSSIFHAAFAYREEAAKRGITSPEMVVSESAHPAFEKAAAILKIKLIKVPIDPKTTKVDLAAVEKAITVNTIFVVGSAPQFPSGEIDDIEGLSEIVIRKSKELKKPIGLHVDACLGGFFLPFVDVMPKWDFRVPGVTSISADTHKYGYAPKGSSVLLYRTQELRKHQYFTMSDSSIGVYATPTIEGSRPGGPIVGTWAAMLSFGKSGYAKLATAIVMARQEIVEGIKKIEGMEIVGNPRAMIVAFRAEKILNIVNEMQKKGWHLNALPGPSVHICITAKHVEDKEFAAKFLIHLNESVEYVKLHPNEKLTGDAGTYGSSMIYPKEVVDEAAVAYFNVIYQLEAKQKVEKS